MLRRDFLCTAFALPAAGLFEPLARLTAADRGKVKITAIRMMPVSRLGHTLIRIDTDAGVSGFGESGVNGEMARAWLGRYRPVLIGQDPLAIERHFFRMSTMIHTYMASIPALSGIDMALWDLAGRISGYPVYTLLGGPFRDRIPLFINSAAGQPVRQGRGARLGGPDARAPHGLPRRQGKHHQRHRQAVGSLLHHALDLRS